MKVNVSQTTLMQMQEKRDTSVERVRELKEARENIREQQYAQIMTQLQVQLNGASSRKDDVQSNHEAFQSFLKEIGYEGKNIAELSQEEAADLVSEDGFFGIKQTSERIAQFVIMGANGDEERFRAGREGILRGFEQAEKLWGGKLPDMAYETIQKAVEMVDEQMRSQGFSVLDISS